MRSWYENEELLKRFREWLGRTEAEIAALGLAGTFDDPADDALPDVGLVQLIEAFTALRQEIKLQTKSNRGLEDAVQQALAGLDEAAEQMRSVEAREVEAVGRAARPLVDALIELDEALERGLRAAETAHANVLDDTVRRYEQAARQRFDRLSVWQRWKSRAWFEQSAALFREQTTDLHRRIMLPLLEGYQLIYERLERTLSQVGIQRIDCLGQPVDPTRMTVVELVDDATVDPETVVGLVRPGYEWRGRLIRYAEVRAARQGIGKEKEQDYEEEEEEDEFEDEREETLEYEDEHEYEYEVQEEHEQEQDRGHEDGDEPAEEDEHDEEDDREIGSGYEAREQAFESEGAEEREPDEEERGYEEDVYAVVVAGMEEREPLDEHASGDEHELEAEPPSKSDRDPEHGEQPEHQEQHALDAGCEHREGEHNVEPGTVKERDSAEEFGYEHGREEERRDEESRTPETQPDPQEDGGRETELESVGEQERTEDQVPGEGQEPGDVHEPHDEQHSLAEHAIQQDQDFPDQPTNPEQDEHPDQQESLTRQVYQEPYESQQTESFQTSQWYPELQWYPSAQVGAEPHEDQEPRERLEDRAEPQDPPPPDRQN